MVQHRPWAFSVAILGIAFASMVLPASCEQTRARVSAKRVGERNELIGGPRALGEVGDWLLENDKVRFIVQDEGFSRGFGVFGGSLIDADLVRTDTGAGDSRGGRGRDNLGELFSAFFVEAIEPTEVIDPNSPPGALDRLPAIEVENDGSDGEEAVIVVRGYGNDFLALTQYANEVLLDDSRDSPRILFENRFRLKPGVRYVEIETTIQNITVPGTELDWGGGERILGAALPTPLGDIALFGAGNKIFVPHEAGYDLRFRLERIYKENTLELPAFPGIVADFLATTGPEVSYALVGAMPDDPETGYAFGTGQFPEARPASLHVPFLASAFTGVFFADPPALAPNDGQPGGADEFTFKRYFVVGHGDVASVADVAYELLGVETGSLTGRVLEDGPGTPVAGAQIIVVDASGKKLTQITADADGRFRGRVPPGQHELVVRTDGRDLMRRGPVDVRVGLTRHVDIRLPQLARVTVTISEDGVGRVPAKVTLVGTYGEEHAGQDPREFLFDLSLGEGWRTSDLVPDTSDPDTRRYLEQWDYTSDGAMTLIVRPGRYTVSVSRGLEYTRYEEDVELTPGAQVTVDARLRRVVDTTGWIGADFHLHSIKSLDSFAGLNARVTNFAGEGMEFAVSSDHNFVTDYHAAIGDRQLERWLNTAVGLELTTIDRGHYNGFPLRFEQGDPVPNESGGYDNTIASRTFGSFNWAGEDMHTIFQSLRDLGRRDEDGGARDVVVQVNHPRGGIGGYFDVYRVNPETLVPEGSSGLFAPRADQRPEFAPAAFSWDFDAMEVINGKRNEWLHHFRVPAGVTQDPVSCCPVEPGQVFRRFGSFECDAEARDCTCTPADAQAQVAAGKCEGEDIVFPGVVEGWLTVLRTGKRVTGTANSDTHTDGSEGGWPRTYVRVPNDSPRTTTIDDIVAGLNRGEATLSLGPFVLADVNGATLGQTATASDGKVTVGVEVRRAPWIEVDRLRVWFEDQVVVDQPIPADAPDTWTTSVEIDVPRDGFVVVEVSGSQNLFPTLVPDEVPPVRLEDALTAIGGSIGLGTNPDAFFPELVKPARPLALTNPIWVDADGDGEISPSLQLPAQPPPGSSTQALTVTRPQPQVVRIDDPGDKQLGKLPFFWRPSDHPADVRRLLVHQLRHAHAE